MHILARLLPNNKLQIKRYRIADGYGRAPGTGESRETLDNLTTGKHLALVEKYTKLIKEVSQPEQHFYDNSKTPTFTSAGVYKSLLEWNKGIAEACSLPETISVSKANPNSKELLYEQLNYYEVCQRRNVALDLLKKSQHSPSKARPWGAKTKLKEFRYQAGEKIKEGGAIIDRFVGVQNSTMVTLTLPGDTWYAFDALARWSGWVVNRLTQLFRRIPKHLPQPYWFFVWEHQKRGALHMHWCIGWKVNRLKREYLAYKVKDLWFSLLEEISVKEKIDLFKGKGFKPTHRHNKKVWKWDVQQINQSVAAYFSKYCAKNTFLSKPTADTSLGRPEHASRKTRKRTTSSNRTCPSRYWGSSQTIKKWAKRLRVECKWVVDSPEFADIVINRIRSLFPDGQSFCSVTCVPFEVIEPSTGICISSGETETYVLSQRDFPAFHMHACKEIMERPYRMDAMDLEFLSTGKTFPCVK